MSDYVSIEGLDKAKVLAALYNGARAQGMGFMQYDPAPMNEEEALKLLVRQTKFEYLKGRVMKVDLSGDMVESWLYDRDNGQGAMEKIITVLRQTGLTNPEEAELQHKEGTRNAAMLMSEHLRDPDYEKDVNGWHVFGIGASPWADQLEPRLKKVLGEEDTDEES